MQIEVEEGGGTAGGERVADAASTRARAAPLPPGDPASTVSPAKAAGGGDVPNRLFYVPIYWGFIAPAMIVAMLPALASTREFPGWPVACMASIALILACATSLFVRLERRWARNQAQRMLVLSAGVAVPMALYGSAAAAWARELGDPFWIGTIGMTGLVAFGAALLLARRPPAIMTALVALWLPLVATSGSTEAWMIFGCGIVSGSVIVWRQTVIYEDAMARRRQQHRVQERALDILVDYEKAGQGWFWETDGAGCVTYLSSNLDDAFGFSVERLYGRPLAQVFAEDAHASDGAGSSLAGHIAARAGFREIMVTLAAGHDRWWSISGSPVVDSLGIYHGFRGFGWDQTEKRRSQERSSRLAHYDSLTGAANRLQMSQALETILNAADEDERCCAMILIDLDRFKQVNDTLGHVAGDTVLKQATDRLRSVIGGAGRIGRLGGDEFQVILPGRQLREELETLAETILDGISQPYTVDGQRATIGASLGIALAPDDGVTAEALIRNADLALYAAKDAGRGRYRFYDSDLHSDAEERRQLQRDLRETVASGGLELWYQPIIHTQTETIAGFEALLRWEHPRLGWLPPAKFVPIAEEIGLISQIGEWVLRTACRDMAHWPATVRVAVNLSPLQFANPSLPAIVTNALASAQVEPDRLELEITESVFLSAEGSTDSTFAALRRIGVRLALDDFGTGYCSLAFLEAARFDRLKLDQTIVRGALDIGSRNSAMLPAIVGLANALGMETTAEGVETEDELTMARALGCSHIQGFIYEAPMCLADSILRVSQPTLNVSLDDGSRLAG